MADGLILAVRCSAIHETTAPNHVHPATQAGSAMSVIRWARVLLVSSAFVLGATPAMAQGNLSTQGLGFPPGQLSTKALSMGGSSGESDGLSPLNTASISLILTSMIAMQAEPEYRQVKIGGQATKTSVARFPLFFGAMPLGTRWTG